MFAEIAAAQTPASFGYAINDAGWVTGDVTPALGEVAVHAFVWNGKTMRDLGTLGGEFSNGSAINNAGSVTGSSTTATGEFHAFLWDGKTMRDLGTLGGSY